MRWFFGIKRLELLEAGVHERERKRRWNRYDLLADFDPYNLPDPEEDIMRPRSCRAVSAMLTITYEGNDGDFDDEVELDVAMAEYLVHRLRS